MWMTGCRLLAQRSFNHARNVKTNLPELFKSSIPLQSTFHTRNGWNGSYVAPSRVISMDCKGPPADNNRKEVKKSSKNKTSSPSQCSSSDLTIHERQVRHKFHEKCVDKINAQINSELCAAYAYISMASFCSQDNVALDGFAKFFTQSYREEMEHMEKFITYLNKRGGELRLSAIAAPTKHQWKQADELVVDALEMEKSLNEKLLQLHACAAQHSDAHLTDFLEEQYLQEQVDAIKTLADLMTTLKRSKQDLGVHLVNRELHGGVFTAHGDGKSQL